MGVRMAVCPALNTVPGIEHMLSMDVNSREEKREEASKVGFKKRGEGNRKRRRKSARK